MSIDVDEIEDPHHKPDYRRANGAPMIVDKEGKNQRFSRPSGWGKELDNEDTLINWKLDTAIRGTASDKAIQARVAAVDDDDRSTKAAIREAAIQAGRGNQASDIGTALHAMSERWEKDPRFDPGEPYRSSLEAYSREMEPLGLVSELFEYQVVNLEYRAAGTADRLYRLTRPLILPTGEYLPEGTLCVGDLKTGKSLDFSLPGYTVQMSLYASGEMYDVVLDLFRPTPDVNQDWGLLVHMPADNPGHCEITWCDLAVGNYGAYLVHEVREWRKKWRSGEYTNPDVHVADPENVLIVEFGATWMDEVETTAIELPPGRALDDQGNVGFDPTWVPMMIPFIKARMKAMRERPDATKALLFGWPAEVPPPKDITEQAHVTMVLDLLDKIEAEFGLPFPEGDPRSTPGAHKSAGPNSNTPKEN